MTIRNLAEMKRAVLTSGVSIRVVSHWQPQLVGTIRTPETVQGNGYWFRAPQFSDGKVVRMWAAYPKSSELRFNADGTVTFYPNTAKTWTLAFDGI